MECSGCALSQASKERTNADLASVTSGWLHAPLGRLQRLTRAVHTPQLRKHARPPRTDASTRPHQSRTVCLEFAAAPARSSEGEGSGGCPCGASDSRSGPYWSCNAAAFVIRRRLRGGELQLRGRRQRRLPVRRVRRPQRPYLMHFEHVVTYKTADCSASGARSPYWSCNRFLRCKTSSAFNEILVMPLKRASGCPANASAAIDRDDALQGCGCRLLPRRRVCRLQRHLLATTGCQQELCNRFLELHWVPNGHSGITPTTTGTARMNCRCCRFACCSSCARCVGVQHRPGRCRCGRDGSSSLPRKTMMV